MSGPQIFRVPLSLVEGRLDPLYYFSVNNLALTKKTKYPVKRLADVIDMQRGRFGHRPRNDPRFYDGAYPFIQTGDVVQASLTDGQISYSQTLNELGLKTSRLFDKPVVVLTIAANIGDTAILDYPACFPDSLIGMSPKSAEISLEYINLYFKFIKEYLNNLAPQSAQKNINYQQLAPVPIVVPPIHVQKTATEIYKNALKQKAKNDTEVQTLLNGVNILLYQHLGIEPLTNQSDRLDQRIFKMRLSQFEGRFDPHFYKIIYQELMEKVISKPHKRLNSLCSFSKEIWDGFSGFEVEFPYLEISDIDLSSGHITALKKNLINEAPSRARMKVRHGDFLVSLTRPNRGAITRSNNEHPALFIASTGFAVLRDVAPEIQPEYLLYVLRSHIVLDQFEQRSSGGNYPAITEEEMGRVLIPLPNQKVQHLIVNEISAIYCQAKALHQQAQFFLAQAKQRVEKMILGADQ
jgi:restriction endonuclease S subunit